MKKLIIVMWILSITDFAFATPGITYVHHNNLVGSDSSDCRTPSTPCLTIQRAVDQLDSTGGIVNLLSAGPFLINSAININDAPILLMGIIGENNSPGTTIHLVADNDPNTQDIAIRIVDKTPGQGTISELRGSNSEIRNIALTVEAPDCSGSSYSCEGSVGGIDIDGAQFVVIDNVHITGFGDDVKDFKFEAVNSFDQDIHGLGYGVNIAPFAIRVHTSAIFMDTNSDGLDDNADFDCADWLKIQNVILEDNYRGFVASGCSNGYITNMTVNDTGPGAAIFIQRESVKGGANFNFVNLSVSGKINGTDLPDDYDYLVYLMPCMLSTGICDVEYRNTNASFVDSTTSVNDTATRHFYVRGGGNMWFNHAFHDGERGIQLHSGSSNNIVGPYEASSLATIISGTGVQNKIWSAAKDSDLDGFYDDLYNSDDLDDDNDTWLDSNDALPLNSAEWLDTDSDSIGNNADTDDDNDSYLDSSDDFPLNPAEWLDTDLDGTGNNADTDDDNDGLTDAQETTLGSNPLVVDTDGDGICDGTDGVACAGLTINATDGGDNCPAVSNVNQNNRDSNHVGNMCDPYDISTSDIGSDPTRDGWVRIGDAVNAGTSQLSFGDTYYISTNFQLIAVMDFTLPSDLVSVQSIKIQVRSSNPYQTGSPSSLCSGGCGASTPVPVDMSIGGFNGDPALEVADGTASATVSAATTLFMPSANSTVYESADLGNTALVAINGNLATSKILQFRLALPIATVNPGASDYYSYTSANHSNTSYHPKLIVRGIRP